MQWHAKNKFMRKHIAKITFYLKECGKGASIFS
jgi:hypothetical protein